LRRDWRTPRRVLWLLGLGTAFSLPGDATLYVALPTHTAQAGISLEGVGLMLSANRIVRVFLNGPYGYFLDRMPRRPILVLSLFLGALSTAMYTIPGFWAMLAGRLLWGVSWIGIWVGGTTVIMDISTDANRGRFSGQYQMWFFLGAGGSSLFSGVLTDWLGYRPGLLISAAVTLAAAVVWLLLLPETRGIPRPLRSRREAPDPASIASPSPPTTSHNRLALATASVLYGVNRLVFAGVLAATFALLLEERVGVVAVAGLILPLTTLTGGLSAARLAFGMTASPLVGWISDLCGDRWLLAGSALAIGAVSVAWMGVGVGVAVVLAALLSAIAMGALQTLVTALAGDHSPTGRRGQAMGLLNTVGDLGSAVGPLMAYALLPLIGLSGVFGLCALVMALMIGWVGYAARAVR
jgi:MFS family permease